MKEHGNFSTKTEFENIPDVPDTVSEKMAGEPNFYAQDVSNVEYMDMLDEQGNPTGQKIRVLVEGYTHRQGERIDHRVSYEQAWAEAHAAKPFMDIAVQARDLFSEELGPEWIDKVDGVNEVIALGKRASDEVGANWQNMTAEQQQDFNPDGFGNLKLAPQEIELVRFVQSNNEVAGAFDEARKENGGVTPNDNSPEWNMILSGLQEKLKNANEDEKNEINAKIKAVNLFTNKVDLGSVKTYAYEDFWQNQPDNVVGPASEMIRTAAYGKTDSDFNLARAAVYEQTTENNTATEALKLFAKYKSTQNEIGSSEFAANKAKENEIRRSVENEIASDPMNLDAAAREAIRVANEKRSELEATGNIKDIKKIDADLRASRAVRATMTEYRGELTLREDENLPIEKFEDFVKRKSQEYEHNFVYSENPKHKTPAYAAQADKYKFATQAFRGSFASTLKLKFVKPAIKKRLQEAGIGQ